MTQPATEVSPSSRSRSTSATSNWQTIAMLLVSGAGFGLAILASGVLFLVGISTVFGEALDRDTSTAILALAWVSLLVGALTLPALVYSLERLFGWSIRLPAANSFRLATIFILLWPLVLVVGNLVSGRSGLAWILLPPLQLLAVGLPIWWLFEFSRRNLPVGSRQRGWGAVSFSMFITTPAVIVTEVLVMAIVFIAVVAWVTTQPTLMTELEQLAERILASQSGGQPDPQAILELVQPYAQNPFVILGIFALLAWIVPLLEELLKPLALWALAGRNITPAEGFSLGALCGAIFALLESLLSLAGPPSATWAALALGRAGTGLLHVTTSALVGWGIASAMQSRVYGRLLAAYLLAAAIHGLWNAMSVLTGLGLIVNNLDQVPGFVLGLAQAAPFGIILLILLLFILVWQSNRRLRRDLVPVRPPASTAVQEPIVPLE